MTVPFKTQIDMGSQKIVNVLDPTANQDAATKNYVDSHSGNASQIQGIPVSTTAPSAGDVFVYSNYGAAQWDVSGLLCGFHMMKLFLGGNSPSLGQIGLNTLITAIPSFTTNGGSVAAQTATATVPYVVRCTNTALASLNSAGINMLSSGSVNYWPLGIWRRFAVKIRLNQSSNVRYWFGIGYSSTGQAGNAVFASDTPNANYLAFRFSSSTDTTIKCCAATDNTHQTVVDSTVSVDTSNLVLFEIVWDGTNANFYINGTRRAQISTNVPSTSQGIGPIILTDNKNSANAGSFDFLHLTCITL